MSISHLVSVAVLVVIGAAAAALPTQATPPHGHVLADGTCFLVTITVKGERETIKTCPPGLPPLPPDAAGERLSRS